MKTREQLEALLGNPNVRAALDTIAAAEGVQHSYATGFGNDQLPSLADHPRYMREFTQTDGKKNQTSAAGRYQFLSRTWDDVAKTLDLTDFGPQSQDLGALLLIERAGVLDDVVNGNFRKAFEKLGPTWASLPSSPHPQGKRSWDFIESALAQAGATPSQQARGLLATMDANTQTPPTAPALEQQQVRDIVDGAFAGFNAHQMPTPELSPIDQARDIQQQAQDDALLGQAISSEAANAREIALAAFLGSTAAPVMQLPRQIESAINRELARIS